MIFKYIYVSTFFIFFNISCQYIILSLLKIDQNLATLISLFTATILSLILKFITDTLFVFNVKVENGTDISVKFSLYSLNGAFSTSVFWVIEYLFYLFFTSKILTLIGGFIGLITGHLLKYYLDKNIVFSNANKK